MIKIVALKHVESQLETAKEEAQRPFPQEDELKEKQARLDQLNIELNIHSFLPPVRF